MLGLLNQPIGRQYGEDGRFLKISRTLTYKQAPRFDSLEGQFLWSQPRDELSVDCGISLLLCTTALECDIM